MQLFTFTALNNKGEPISGASVSIFNAGTSVLATIYEDDQTTELPKPLTTDGNGLAICHLPNGTYDWTVEKNATLLKSVTGQVFYDPAEYDPSLFNTNSPLTTEGDMLYHDGTANVRLPKGTDGQALVMTSGLPAWGAAAGGGGLPNNGYVTGRKYLNGILQYDGSNDTSMQANRLYAVPFYVGADATFTKIGISVQTLDSGKSIRLGIYNYENGLPTTLVLDAGTVSAGTTGEKEITISQFLSAGLYCLACISDGVPTIECYNTNSALEAFVIGRTTLATTTCRFVYAVTYGALPSTYSTSPTLGSSAPAAMWLSV